MNFEAYLLREIKHHPSVMPCDMIKLCFQAAFGAEHLIEDKKRARAYFDAEYEAVTPREMPLFEEISPSTSRINLAAWKAKNLPSEWLFRMFLLSASEKRRENADFFALLTTVGELAKQGSTPFSYEAWEAEKAVYLQKEPVPVHHSEAYRKAEHPTYRLADSRLLRLLPVLEAVARADRMENCAFVIAIDGRAASGKSTMTEQLTFILDAADVHMDDFFLPSELRTAERLSQTGGNIHYERFAEEVLPYLHIRKEFSYGKFHCGSMSIQEKRFVKASNIRIVEGAYALHPFFGSYADLSVFSNVTSQEQMARIRMRNGNELAKVFHEKWIPMEEAYFLSENLPMRAQLCV